MDNPYSLTLEDLADRLGMSARHLTNKKNGPVTRVLETYYWLDLCEGDSYAEHIVGLLEDYLANCGKRGENIDYPTWQRSIWEQNDIESLPENSSLALVSPPAVEVVSADVAIGAVADSVLSFNTAIDGFDSYFDAIGEQIGNRAVTRVAVATKKSIDNGLTQLLNNISKMGGN
jgi:transcriptional regulator with XRE-family HTH domain